MAAFVLLGLWLPLPEGGWIQITLSAKSLGGARRQESVQLPTSLAPQRSLAQEPGFWKPLTGFLETQDAGILFPGRLLHVHEKSTQLLTQRYW